MKIFNIKYWLVLLLSILPLTAIASDTDYSQLKPERFKTLKDGQLFSDKQGNYKIEKTERNSGVLISVTKRGKTVWKRHGPQYKMRGDGSTATMTTYDHL